MFRGKGTKRHRHLSGKARAGESATTTYLIVEGEVDVLDGESGETLQTIPAGRRIGERFVTPDGRWRVTLRAADEVHAIAASLSTLTQAQALLSVREAEPAPVALPVGGKSAD